jgi:hypothetical protein
MPPSLRQQLFEMKSKFITLTVYERGRNGNPRDLTFLVEGQGSVNPATHIHVEYYDSKRDLTYSSELENVRGTGLLTYNDTIDTNNVTLSGKRRIREAFIERFQLSAGTRLQCRFRILEDGTHVFQIDDSTLKR